MVLTFTVCSNNYLAQAIILGKSLLRFNPNYKFIIGLVDRKKESIAYDQIPFEVIEVEKINNVYFHEMALKYNIYELNTSMKPFFFNTS